MHHNNKKYMDIKNQYDEKFFSSKDSKTSHLIVKKFDEIMTKLKESKKIYSLTKILSMNDNEDIVKLLLTHKQCYIHWPSIAVNPSNIVDDFILNNFDKYIPADFYNIHNTYKSKVMYWDLMLDNNLEEIRNVSEKRKSVLTTVLNHFDKSSR